MVCTQHTDRVIVINNQEYLYFGGTHYLGVTTDFDFQDILFKNIKKWGTAFGSSRNSNVKLNVYDFCESDLANFFNFEAALSVSSGMLAGKIVVDYLDKNNDCVFHLEKNHPAIYSKNSLPLFENEDLNSIFFEKKITKIAILTDSYPTSTVLPIDLNILHKIPKNIAISLLIDESHSIGITGNNGQGVGALFKKLPVNEVIMMASLGKAFGLSGGIIAGSKTTIQNIKQEEALVGASAMNPAFLQTFSDSKEIYLAKMHALKKNLAYLSANLKPNNDLLFQENYPLIYFENTTIYNKLLANFIIPTSFNYPTPEKKLNRLVITANHTLADLDKLISVINS